MPRLAAIILACLVAVSAAAQSGRPPERSQFDEEHTQWIASALRSMQSIKVGMTRADLMNVFTTEGGLSAPELRTYVYRECPYIKVDVKFDPSDREQELPTDKITEISRPYLAWSIMD